MTTETRVLTIADAAEYVGHSVHTLRLWRAQNRSDRPLGYKAGAKVVYDRQELDDWLDQQRTLETVDRAERTARTET